MTRGEFRKELDLALEDLNHKYSIFGAESAAIELSLEYAKIAVISCECEDRLESIRKEADEQRVIDRELAIKHRRSREKK